MEVQATLIRQEASGTDLMLIGTSAESPLTPDYADFSGSAVSETLSSALA